MQKIDWNAEARLVVRHVSEHMFEAHRGAMPWKRPGISVAFGNDGAGERQDREIAALRSYLEERQIDELGFAKSTGEDADYSWAMLIRSGNPDQFVSVLWDGWMSRAEGTKGFQSLFRHLQASTALRVIAEHGIEPELVTK